jgi:hypothetical protein
MSDASVADARTQRFAEAVRNFAGVPPKRFASLLPHREGITELRRKGASFGMIRELLAMAGIEVAADTVRRFYRDVIEEPRNGAKKSLKRERSSEPAPLNPPTPAASSSPAPSSPAPPAAAETPRTRGPRIADPRNL